MQMQMLLYYRLIAIGIWALGIQLQFTHGPLWTPYFVIFEIVSNRFVAQTWRHKAKDLLSICCWRDKASNRNKRNDFIWSHLLKQLVARNSHTTCCESHFTRRKKQKLKKKRIYRIQTEATQASSMTIDFIIVELLNTASSRNK